MQNFQEVQLAAASLKRALPAALQAGSAPACAVILGTGLSETVFASLSHAVDIPFSDIPGIPRPGVDSHKGFFRMGLLADRPVFIQCGRVHLYEGHTPASICMGVRIMAELGAGTLIATNAAGALNPLFGAGQLMLMTDIINHTGVSPLTGPNTEAWGERFPDMSQVFSPALMKLARTQALRNGIDLQRGVYIGVHGPEMETPAETRMYRQWGADAVGMSTVLELIAARHRGMACLGVSCLTNKNLPDCMEAAPIETVISMAQKCSAALGLLLEQVIANMD